MNIIEELDWLSHIINGMENLDRENLSPYARAVLGEISVEIDGMLNGAEPVIDLNKVEPIRQQPKSTDDWNHNLSTMPNDFVEVKTVTGLVRKAKPKIQETIPGTASRIACN